MTDFKIRRFLSILVIISGILIGSICILYQYHHYKYGSTINISSYPILQEGEYAYGIDALVKENRDYDFINGWIAVEGHSVLQYNTQLLLYTDDSDIALCFQLTAINRDNASVPFEDGEDYNPRGFQRRIKSSPVEEKEYKIGFLIDVDRELKLIMTDQVYRVSNGEG